MVVNYFIVSVWLSPLRSPGAFAGCHLGSSIHFTHAGTEPSDWGESSKAPSDPGDSRKSSLKMPNVVDNKHKAQREDGGVLDF